MNKQMQIQQMMGNPQFQKQYQQRLRGMNPAEILDQIANNPQAMSNPMVKNVMEMRNNNDTEGLTGMAENMFGQKGQNYSDFEKNAKQFLGF
ncbi:hypothetical protein AALC75_26440 [Lachnospiraceae bacterium 48-42]